VTTTEGMKGGGYYDDHSQYQQRVAATGASLIEECTAAVPLPGSEEAVVVVDYGASTGANSMRRFAPQSLPFGVASPTNQWRPSTTTCRPTIGTSSSPTWRRDRTAT
jgi:hypothetical protein